ncbi:uncharacterized protein LOC131317783 [Rhododendron vialii]|uniref:uncharacterized protein LOC131317783 n=1 Tax=Rhododendron vialii TaxID=182163 RepID=UPI00265D70DA|nr:uncharacterized protein LOC131317783 [Rhododendron vialii]XP_058203408.1 uncharacterized protein LOC131317783 [Rhododendron vialii]
MPPLHGPQGYAFMELVLAFQENLAPAQSTLASGTMTALVTLLAGSGMVGAMKAFRMSPIFKMIACRHREVDVVRELGQPPTKPSCSLQKSKTSRRFHRDDNYCSLMNNHTSPIIMTNRTSTRLHKKPAFCSPHNIHILACCHRALDVGGA